MTRTTFAAIVFLPATCLAMLLGAVGCAEATIATAGTVAGIAAAGISTGADVYRMGKLESADIGSFEQWTDAARSAANDLHLNMERQEYTTKGNWRCTIADDHETRMRIYVERRTASLCRMKIDVGIFGSEPTARLMLARMRSHVPTSQPVDTASPPGPATAP